MPHRTLDEYLKQTTRITIKQQVAKPKYRITGFYSETEFQKTPIGKIPKEWKIVKLYEISDKIKAGGTPRVSKKEYWNGNIPFVKIEDLTASGKYLYSTKTFITELGLEKSNAWIVPEESLLLAMYGSMGEVAINKIKVATNQAILGIIPRRGVTHVEYLYYWFLYFKPKWRVYAKWTTQPNLTAEIVRNSYVPLPPLEEQWGIAEVLSSIDEAIEATERLIGRLERLKRGLMQELLTKGIGHREYKQTPVGKIPKEWKIVKIENIAKVVKTGPFGSQLRKSELTRKGIKVYTQENILKRDFSIGNLYISEKKFNQLKNFEVRPNDVLLTIRGTVGKAAVVPYHVERGIIHTNLAIIRVDNTKILPRYLELIINEADIVARQVKASHSSTTLPALYAGTIKRLKIPLPSLEEQKKIVDIISSINKWIELERKRKEKLERLKRGLMELLLAGRVRVRVERFDDEGNLPGSGGGAGS